MHEESARGKHRQVHVPGHLNDFAYGGPTQQNSKTEQNDAGRVGAINYRLGPPHIAFSAF